MQDNNDDNEHANNDEFEYKNLISQFASQKARKIYFKWNILYNKNIK